MSRCICALSRSRLTDTGRSIRQVEADQQSRNSASSPQRRARKAPLQEPIRRFQTALERRPFIAGQRAYSSPKLCNVLTARALAAHPDTTARRLSAIAYDTGHTPGTHLVRNENFAIKFLWKSLAPALRLTRRGSNTPEAAGECLAKLALGQTRPPSGKIYAALRSGTITWPEPSELALRDDLRDALWRDSSALVGLTSAG